ncbi:MAG: isoprenylcysteine carboxylmethyltransferase family protein [Candidatus Eisenbacteria bacterium]
MRKPILPPTYFVLAVVLVLALRLLLPGPRWIPFPLSLIGAVPILAGVVMNLVADRQLKIHETTVKPFLPSTALVTDGAFARSRNPMYAGMALILLGLALLLGRPAPLFVAPLFACWMDRLFIRKEEEDLARQFGPAFEAYRKRTRRWI